MNKKLQGFLLVTTLSFVLSVHAADSINSQPEAEVLTTSVNYEFTGDNTRIGIGYDWDTDDIWGELFYVLTESDDDAWIAELWGKSSAGGAKLNYHWASADGDNTKTAVNKVFFAFDQNEYDDQKLTAGYGRENQRWFWGAYVSAGISGERDKASTSSSVSDYIFGVEDNRPFQQLVTTTTVINQFEKPYDYGVGLRAGHFYSQQMLRLRGGLDYEVGDFDSSRATVSIGIEKYFANTPHSIALTGSYSDIQGDFETDNHDASVMLSYRYEFGKRYRVINKTERVAVRRAVTVPTAPIQVRKQLVKTKVTLSDEAFFGLGLATLSPQVKDEISKLVAAIKKSGYQGNIRVTGHTCDLGSEQMNQGLSERRAGTISSLMKIKGISASKLIIVGKGELEPKYPNDIEANRKKNRRVHIEYITYKDAPEQNAVPLSKTVTEWEERVISELPDWSKQALHNPVSHKRKVDYYRYEEASETVTFGEREYLNRLPEAVDDSYSMELNSHSTLSVLDNDSDPDGDALSIQTVSQPAHGTAVITSGQVTYTPVAGYIGADTFTYVITDGNGGTDTATVTITVTELNRIPVAESFTVRTPMSTAVTFDVLSHASDPDNDPLVVTSVTGVKNGTIVINADQTVTYTPTMMFCGIELLEYTVSDGRGGTATAIIRIIVGNAD